MRKEIVERRKIMSDEKKLNLPAISKSGGLQKKELATKKISSLDLSKKSTVDNIIRKEEKSIQQELIDKNRGLDLILVGDLTASMTDYHALLKSKFKELCKELFSLIKNLRIGIIFYLDHDNHLPYVTTVCQPTNDIERLYHFIETSPVSNDGNSTFDEAVEDALNDLFQNIQWKELHNRSVVLFGDASCHPCNQCPHGHDFFEITKGLYHNGTTINSIFCGNQRHSEMQLVYPIEIGDFDKRIDYLNHDAFFSWIANVTGGMALNIENVDDLIDIIITSAAKDSGNLDDLEARVKSEPKKLKLITIAKKAQSRKISAGHERKLLN